MENLISCNSHLILSKIFLNLDARSLKNARCVCKSWNNYIKTHIWQFRLYRDRLTDKLDDQWQEFKPTEQLIRCQACVFDIATDEVEYVFSLERGKIEVWSRFDLVKNYEIPSAGAGHGLRLGLTKDFIIGGFFDKFFSLWHRQGEGVGQLYHDQEVESNVHGLKVVANKIVVSMVNGEIAVYNLNQYNQIEKLTSLSGGVRSPCHFSCQGTWLLHTYARKQLVLIDLEQNVKVQTMTTLRPIWKVCLHYPIAVTHGLIKLVQNENEANLEQETEFWQGIIMWNVIQGTKVKEIQMNEHDLDVKGIAIDAKRLVILTTSEVLLLTLTPNLDLPILTINKLPESQRSELVGIKQEKDQLLFQVSAGGLIKVLNFWYGSSKTSRPTFRTQISDSGVKLGWKSKVIRMRLC